MEFLEVTRRLRAHARATRKRYKANGAEGRSYDVFQSGKGWELEVWTNQRFDVGYVFDGCETAKQAAQDIESGCFDDTLAKEKILIS